MNNHYERLKSQKLLERSWQHVRAVGRKSTSKESRKEIREFESEATSAIRSISGKLSAGTFCFHPGYAHLIKKKSGKYRAIVKGTIGSRVVQRCLLEVLNEDQNLFPKLNFERSYGGVKGVGVEDAIRDVHSAIVDGYDFYLKSDIANFFTHVPLDGVRAFFRHEIKDKRFVEVLESSLSLELENMQILSEHPDLFPTYERGVAQGCCLSPMVANLVLNEFDRKLNSEGLRCFRYLDDFIIMGKSYNEVRAGFKVALKTLKELGLTAYEPGDGSGKSDEGPVSSGFDYLGAYISPREIRPSKDSWRRFKKSLDETFSDSINAIKKDPLMALKKDYSYIDILSSISRRVQGWGNQFKYCNSDNFFLDLDKYLDEKIFRYQADYRRAIAKLNEKDKRRALGVFSFSDCKRVPIIESM